MTFDACETREDYKNRRKALWVGWICTLLCMAVISAALLDAYKKDKDKAAKLAAQSEMDEAENAIVDSLDFGRAIVSKDGKVISFNAALKKWTRCEDAEGKYLVDFVPDDMKDLHLAAFKAAMNREGKSKPRLVECVLPRVDDPSKVTHVSIVISIVRPKEKESTPYVVAYVFKTKGMGETIKLGSSNQ